MPRQPNNNLGNTLERDGVIDWRGITEFNKGTQQGKAQPNAGTSIRRFMVRSDRLWFFQRQVLGHPYLAGDGTLRRHLPLRDYTRPGGIIEGDVNLSDSPLIATSFNDQPFDKGALQKVGELVRPWTWGYGSFVVDVGFETVRYKSILLSETTLGAGPFELQRFTITDVENGGQFLVTEYAQWKLAIPDPNNPGQFIPKNLWPPAGTKFGVFEAESKITIRWLDVIPAAWNEPRAQGMNGKCNSGTFIGKGPETLLLVGVNRIPFVNVFGQELHEVRFEFLYRSTGINKKFYWSESTGKVYLDVFNVNSATSKPVETADFSQLFVP